MKFLKKLPALAGLAFLLPTAAHLLPRCAIPPRDASSACFTTTLIETVPQILIKDTAMKNPGDATAWTTVRNTITTDVVTTRMGVFCEVTAQPETTTSPPTSVPSSTSTKKSPSSHKTDAQTSSSHSATPAPGDAVPFPVVPVTPDGSTSTEEGILSVVPIL